MKQVPHHIHKRKRIHKDEGVPRKNISRGKDAHTLDLKARLRPYPAKDPMIRLLDRIVTVVGVIMPLSTLPQLYNVWILRQTAGVSPLTWGVWAVLNIPFLIYSIVHKARPLIACYILWVIVEVLVLIGVLIF